MAIRDARLDRHRDNPDYQRYLRKANQEWELAGCARQDSDIAASNKHTQKALEYQRMAKESLG